MITVSGLEKSLTEKCDNVYELVGIKGETKLELYRHGFKPGDTLNVMSVTKSVLALLTGIAIDRGLIFSIDDKVLDYYPDYVPKKGEKTIKDVTLRHLLTMTAPYKYRSEPWKRVCTSPDWTKAALDLLGGRKGITGAFLYSTLGIQILGGIVAWASKMSLSEFANRYLFAPLGIAPHHNDAASSQAAQLDFLMSKRPKGDVWFADPQGANTAGWGLALGAMDMAKIGLLCLNKGVYEGQRIVSEKWISEVTAPSLSCGYRFGGMSYGLLFWIVEPDLRVDPPVSVGRVGRVGLEDGLYRARPLPRPLARPSEAGEVFVEAAPVDAHLAAEGEHGPARGELRYHLVLKPLIETNSFSVPLPSAA
jgi:CubicO group peptidase (beta-lactamase class C family)